MSKPLESLLRQAGLVSEPVLHRSLEQSRKRGVSLVDVLISEGLVTEEALADALSRLMKLPRIRLANSAADPEAIKRLSDKVARKHACLPLKIEGRVLVVAMVNPADYLAIQDIEFAAAMSVKPVVATRTEILDGIEERYDPEDRIGDFLANVPDVSDIQIFQDDSQQDLSMEVADTRSATDAPVVKMVNLVVYDALKAGSSDLHIEPTLHDVQVRMRVDGVLRDYTRVPKWLHGPVVSRLKILAKLDIAERRLPQDGRINVQYQGRTIDIRVSTLPTHFGEKVVLRILGGSTLPKIAKLGFDESQTASVESSIAQPQGIILITGPTGSGKTTTLYAMLARRRSPEVNIVTVEDPIEYQLAGINQVQVNPKAGLSFASVLRSILRQDPDVILVGELRDQETAEVAFQAAMTGHLVLTTLHTNSAPAAIPRLFDLEVDPSILSTSLTLVIAQRLVRRICEGCRESYVPDLATATKVGLTAGESAFRGRGCQACGSTGYAGRIGIYEFLRPTSVVRKLIHEQVGEADLRNAARQGGMKTLREDALAKIKAGITSPDEVMRVVQIDETEVPCPNCKAPIETDFSTCPYCLHSIKVSCQACGQELKPGWKACPYCHTKSAGAAALAQEPVEVEAPPALVRPTEQEAAPVAPPPRRRPAHEKPPPAAPAAETEPAWEMKTVSGKVIEDEPPPTIGEKFVTPGAGRYPGVQMFDFELPENAGAAAASAKPEEGKPDLDLDVSLDEEQNLLEAVDEVLPAGRGLGGDARPTGPQADISPGVGQAPLEGADVEPAGAYDAGPVTEDDLPESRRLRILVVDDDEDIRQVVSFTLRKLPVAVDVVTAEDGQDAVEQAEATPPDLVVLDVMMPRMDGFETCQRLRKNVRTAFVPVLMLTASADEASRTKGYLVGTDDYMSKPFMPPDLSLRVTRLLRRTYGI
ncbi:MAG: ATPase, T2SS/T4P/T4SS family [Acidobacteriota bacterium]